MFRDKLHVPFRRTPALTFATFLKLYSKFELLKTGVLIPGPVRAEVLSFYQEHKHTIRAYRETIGASADGTEENGDLMGALEGERGTVVVPVGGGPGARYSSVSANNYPKARRKSGNGRLDKTEDFTPEDLLYAREALVYGDLEVALKRTCVRLLQVSVWERRRGLAPVDV